MFVRKCVCSGELMTDCVFIQLPLKKKKEKKWNYELIGL